MSARRTMQPAGLIVCERRGSWAMAWRRALAATARGRAAVRISETRSLAECRETLLGTPASVVSIELTAANLALVLDFLAAAEWEFPAAAIVVTAARALDEAAGAMREFGAAASVTSPRRMEPLAELVRRQLARQPLATSSAVERIRAELPWQPV